MRARTNTGPNRCGRAALAALAVLALAGNAGTAMAEPLGQHFEFSQFGGYTVFDDARNHLTPYGLEDGVYLGGRFAVQAEHWFGLELAGGFSPTKDAAPAPQNFDFFHISGNVMVRPLRAAWGWPYLFGGGGTSHLKYSGGGPQDHQGNAELGGGVQVWMNDAIGLRFEARDILWLPRTDMTSPESQDWVYGLGLTFAIAARARDTDGDGVPDRDDRCAGTPAHAKVDATGCPLDADHDSVFDGLDQCPATPKGCVVDAKGCPLDADGDGVCDGLDQCASTPHGAKVDSAGCPIDTDADSVWDGLDQCAGTPKGAKVDSVGCPIDSDGDGVADGIDQCPDTPQNLRVDQVGCPIEIAERETELLDTGMIRVQNIQFQTGKAELPDSAKAQLDIIGAVLVKWPELKIEIGGHTDSRGATKYNQRLSEDRVRAGLDYLLAKFPALKPEQYVAKGYGESKPLVPNTTPEAMAINRRVEFVVLNKDVLRREIERRKLLEKSEPGK